MERRTQAERSAATKRALIDAAIESLMARGWAATTAVEVCERARCTRGALIHHYPSLSALLAHALESLYDDFTEGSGGPIDTLVDVVELTWRAAGDPRFKAVIEAWSAAGNEPELASDLGPAIMRFAKLVSPVGTSSTGPIRDEEAETFVLLAREAMLGLALGRATNGGRPLGHEPRVVARLRAEAAALDARPPASPRTPSSRTSSSRTRSRQTATRRRSTG